MIKTLYFTLLISSTLIFTSFKADANPIDHTLEKLKTDLVEYQDHTNNYMWLVTFKQFLVDDIINSPDKNELIKLACQSWTGKSHDNCITGPFSFYQAVMGLKNSIEVIHSHCQFNPDIKNCIYYKRFLKQNITQLKFILKIH